MNMNRILVINATAVFGFKVNKKNVYHFGSWNKKNGTLRNTFTLLYIFKKTNDCFKASHPYLFKRWYNERKS